MTDFYENIIHKSLETCIWDVTQSIYIIHWRLAYELWLTYLINHWRPVCVLWHFIFIIHWRPVYEMWHTIFINHWRPVFEMWHFIFIIHWRPVLEVWPMCVSCRDAIASKNLSSLYSLLTLFIMQTVSKKVLWIRSEQA